MYIQPVERRARGCPQDVAFGRVVRPLSSGHDLRCEFRIAAIVCNLFTLRLANFVEVGPKDTASTPTWTYPWAQKS